MEKEQISLVMVIVTMDFIRMENLMVKESILGVMEVSIMVNL